MSIEIAPARDTDVVAFRSVLCGIDDTAATEVAVEQAAVLAGPGSTLDLVVCLQSAFAQSAQPRLTREVAERALDRLTDLAVEGGVAVHSEVVEAGFDRHPLLSACAGHDLLVVGSHEIGRPVGILSAGVMTASTHLAPCPVLIARESPAGFPGTILLADDGTRHSREAARLAHAIAAQHGCELVAASGVDDRPAKAIPALAARIGAGLIVLGSRRLRGPRALASVSERVAHNAPCSVLVVRDRPSPR